MRQDKRVRREREGRGSGRRRGEGMRKDRKEDKWEEEGDAYGIE